MVKIASIDVGTVHLGFCIIESETEEILVWENIDLGSFPTEGMIEKLSNIPLLWDCETILIEQQPSINAKMKSFSREIKMFLTVRKIDYKKNFNIQFYSSKYKNEVYDGDIPESLFETKSGKPMKSYEKTKKTAVYIMKQIIHKQSEDNIAFFMGHTEKCKRDLSDCYLQAISFVRRTKRNSSTIMMRKPSSKQVKFKKYSKSNLKYILVEDYFRKSKNVDDFIEGWNIYIKKAFGVNYTKLDLKEIIPDEFLDRF